MDKSDLDLPGQARGLGGVCHFRRQRDDRSETVFPPPRQIQQKDMAAALPPQVVFQRASGHVAGLVPPWSSAPQDSSRRCQPHAERSASASSQDRRGQGPGAGQGRPRDLSSCEESRPRGIQASNARKADGAV